MARFVCVGSVAVSIDFAVYRALWVVVGHAHPAKAVSFVAATFAAYLLNRSWTFRADGDAGRLLGFVALYTCTFTANVGVNALALSCLSPSEWRVPIAFLMAQATSTSINFIVLRAVIFRALPTPPGVEVQRDVQVSVLR